MSQNDDNNPQKKNGWQGVAIIFSIIAIVVVCYGVYVFLFANNPVILP